MYIFVGTNSCNTKLIKSSSRLPGFALEILYKPSLEGWWPIFGTNSNCPEMTRDIDPCQLRARCQTVTDPAVNGQYRGQDMVNNIARMEQLKSPPWSAICFGSLLVLKLKVLGDSLFTFQRMSVGAAPARAPRPGSGSVNTPSSGAWTWSRWPAAWSPRPWWCTETEIKIIVYNKENVDTSGTGECSLRREAIRNALFLQRKVPENPHRKKLNAKLLAPSKTCPNWTNLIYISLASVSKCGVQCGPLWLIVNCGLAPCLIRST